MEVNLIVETLKFLVLGMSTVFMFLALMVVVLELQAKIIMKYFPPPKENSLVSNSTQELFQKGNFSVVAAIAASIRSYKKKSK
ncbi:MAG: putative oxaloacetate decarboxylase alpha chain [Proteobacteria bacterium]|nr:putative oxaloacetate decarboxylase alpha chain [Pseudomonadota bacterium]